MSYTLLSETTRTAAKRYHCIWCWQLIERGEKHVHEVSVNDGSMQNHRWHPECRAAMLEEAAYEGGFIEWTPGQERPKTAADLEFESWVCKPAPRQVHVGLVSGHHVDGCHTDWCFTPTRAAWAMPRDTPEAKLRGAWCTFDVYAAPTT